MKRTSVATVILLIAIAVAVTYLVEFAVVTSGGTSLVPPYSLPLTLVAVGAAVIGLAVPVRRRVTGKRAAPLSPFYSVRVAVLAKSCSLTGSILVGVGLGILIHVLGRPVSPWVLLWPGIAQTAGSIVLLLAGLIAERMCTLPPNDDKGHAAMDASGGSHA